MITDPLVELLQKKYPGRKFEIRKEYNAENMAGFAKLIVNGIPTKYGYDIDKYQRASSYYAKPMAELLEGEAVKIGMMLFNA